MKSDGRQRNIAAHSSRHSGNPGDANMADAEYASRLLDAAEGLAAVSTPNDEGSMSIESAPAAAASSLIVLPAQCTMRDALELKSQLLGCFDSADAVQIDVAKLERIDAAGMQVLLAFVLDRAKQDRNVEWCGINTVIRDAAKAMGLAAALRLPAEAAA
jgi:ABC-type transporter Mla MlaB component